MISLAPRVIVSVAALDIGVIEVNVRQGWQVPSSC